MRSWLAKLRPVVLVVGLAFMAWALVGAIRGIDELGWPSLASLVAAVLCSAVGITSAGVAWSAIVAQRTHVQLVHGFVLAQLGKYVPGGIWQAGGQIDAAVRFGIPARRASVMFVTFAVSFVAVAGVIGGALVVVDVDVWLAIAAGVGAAGSLLVLVFDAGSRIGRLIPRIGASGDSVSTPLLAVAGFAGYFVGQGVAVMVLVHSLTGELVWALIPAYAVAWAVGFAVAPVPAGVGIREAVLLLVLTAQLTDDAILAASVLLRLAAIVGEALVIALGLVITRRARAPESPLGSP
jgi:glycosyltransferase 2 family protein